MKRAPDRSALELAHGSADRLLDLLGQVVRKESSEDEIRATLVEYGRTIDGHRTAPPVAKCRWCGQIMATRSRVHHASVHETRTCPGSWEP